ncbi:MAG: hypothetical protein IPH07_38315 [Deltaproteobacteria bacterium]|nr:hypothetical protein [Deltaproteobacteria bacterium]MBP7288844.1 hypothetical protein [Nannocystaceae bacterium]
MSSPRPFLAATLVALAIGAASCEKKQETGTNAPLVINGTAPVVSDDPGGKPATNTPRPAIQKLNITGTITGIPDLFDAFREINARWADGDTDARAELQAGLLQAGFSPSFLDNLDLAGAHSVWFAYPQQSESATPADVNLAASIAVIDGRKVIEGAPASSRPQPLGDGMWELKSADSHLLIKENGKELLLGLSPQDIARAGSLRAEAKTDHHITSKLWNIPKDELDPAALFGLQGSSKPARELAEVLKNLESISLVADAAPDKDATLVVSADAPFSRLGIEPIGKARGSATAIEGKLPGNPMFVSTLSWGDPALLERTLTSQVPVSQLPEPFASIVKQALDASVTLLKQVANDVVIAIYVDASGKPTALVAADVKDDAKTRDAMHAIADAIKQAVEAQNTLAGKQASAKIGLEWKPGGVAVAGGKADKMVLRAPKDLAGEIGEASILLNKDALDVISMVQGNAAVIAIGPGAKALATDVAKGLAKPRKDSLAQHTGLGRLRTTMGGCQICVAFDPTAYLRFRVALMIAKDKTAAKQGKSSLAELKKVGNVGSAMVGFKVEPKQGAMGSVLPKELLFANKAAVATLKRVNDLVDAGGASVVATPPGAKKEPAPKKAPPKGKAG